MSFIEGILTFISPCILPLLPVYYLYLAGDTSESVAKGAPKNRLLFNAAGFVLGFSLVFVLLGATATIVGRFLGSNRDIFRIGSGLVMILFGLNFLGLLRITIPGTSSAKVGKYLDKITSKTGFIHSVLFGIVFAFSWTPCLSAFLGSALIMAGNSETMLQGILMLVLFSLGLGVPFLVSAAIFDRAREVFAFFRKHGRIINIVSGIVLILAGILVITDRMKYLGTLFT